jgi:hypothetical protein
MHFRGKRNTGANDGNGVGLIAETAGNSLVGFHYREWRSGKMIDVSAGGKVKIAQQTVGG